MKSDSSIVPINKELIIGKMFFPYFTNNYEMKFKGCTFFNKDGSAEPGINGTPASETIEDNWKLSLTYNPTDLKKQEDIYLLINYSLIN